MTDAWTLMTAMPPTKGHIGLIQWMNDLPVRRSHVVVCTQPGEPYAKERFEAVKAEARKISHRIFVHHVHQELPEDPESEGFWEFWWNLMKHGRQNWWGVSMEPGDFFVSSEAYGAKLAQGINAVFMPYDPGRELISTKATAVRNDMLRNFADIAPAFQHNLRTTATIFGAESTGKTTLSKEVAGLLGTHWLFEWARPYLETVGPEITKEKMHAIWAGQGATQRHGWDFYDKPYMVQDTDLFSTVGYWDQPHWESELGPVPEFLIDDAIRLKSDLYIITRSNIGFEPDPIRYGGDHRESPDSYWISIAEKYDLNYVVLNASERHTRIAEAMTHLRNAGRAKAETLKYERKFNG
jgi:HTH-type transcriptional regulator, transcriptional repressor of NAD biosynthesis genes